MVAFGFGEVIGGIIFGWIIDKIGSQKTSVVNSFVVAGMTFVTYISIQRMKYDTVTFIMCFLWGF